MGADVNDPHGGEYSLDDQVGFLLRLANQRHTTIFQTHTLHGLTPTQFTALIRIAEQGECSQNHLGRLAAMDVATIKGVVDRLREKGLITIKPAPHDRRRSQISLSPEGEKLVGPLREAGHRITQETLQTLTASEQRNLLKILRKIC